MINYELTIPAERTGGGNEYRYNVAGSETAPHILLDVCVEGVAWQWRCANLTPDEADQLAAALVSAAREAREA